MRIKTISQSFLNKWLKEFDSTIPEYFKLLSIKKHKVIAYQKTDSGYKLYY